MIVFYIFQVSVFLLRVIGRSVILKINWPWPYEVITCRISEADFKLSVRWVSTTCNQPLLLFLVRQNLITSNECFPMLFFPQPASQDLLRSPRSEDLSIRLCSIIIVCTFFWIFSQSITDNALESHGWNFHPLIRENTSIGGEHTL